MPEPKPHDAADLDADVDEASAMCGGAARAAVRALLIANAFLERELELARVAMSRGYSRGWHWRRGDKT